MTGPEVRNILKNENLHLKDVAQMLGMTQPNFTQLLQVKDVKTGLLEKMCDVLDKKMDFFYRNSKYLSPTPSAQPTSDDAETLAKDKEIEFLKGKILALEEMNEKLMKIVSRSSSERSMPYDKI